MAENKLSLGNFTGEVGAAEPAIIEQSAGTPSWSTEIPIEGPPEELELLIGVQCKNMPVGSKYQFSIPAGTTREGEPWEELDSGPHVIRTPDEMIGLPADWPAGVQTVMTLSWWAEGTTPQPGAILEPFIAILGAGLQVRFA